MYIYFDQATFDQLESLLQIMNDPAFDRFYIDRYLDWTENDITLPIADNIVSWLA